MQRQLKAQPLAVVNQVVNIKKKQILKEIESVTPVKIRKKSSLIAGMEDVLVGKTFWIEDQTSHNIFFKPKPNPLINLIKAKRVERAAEE